MLHLYDGPMANISSPLQPAPPSRPTRRSRPQRRLAVVAVLTAFCLSVLAGPLAEAGSAQSQPSPDQARQRREEIRKQQSQIAADLQPLAATDEELNKALEATNNQVRTQQAKVNDAQRAADEAQRNADWLAADQARLQTEVDQLKAKVRDRAVSAYMNPQGKVDQEALLLQTSDLTEAERKKEFVATVTGTNDDAVDKLRAVRQSLEQTRSDSENAAADARTRRSRLDTELATMKESQAQQAKVKAMVDSRIQSYKREAAELRAEDASMQQIIEEAQRRYQQQLEEAARQRAAQAAAQQAAAQQAGAQRAPSGAPAPAPAPPSGGGSAAANGSFHWPLVPTMISQEFGGANGHPGMDMVASLGTPVAASNGGVVISAGWNNGGYGNLVLIDHGGGIVTAYAHLSAISVAAGTFLNGGTIIGAVGSTGNSTGPHLHFEVRVNGAVQNPRNYLS